MQKVKAGLSVVILAKNSQDKIKKFLDSVKNWADEIIVVDDLSNDNTVEICKEYGCKVFIRPLNNDFSSQRNFGVSHAKGLWILTSAPDEWLEEEAKQKITTVLNNPLDFVAFRIKRKNFFMGEQLLYASTLSWDTRIFKKGSAYYVGTPHEKLIVDGKIGDIDAEINHFAFESINQTLRTMFWYTDLEAKEFLKNKENISFKEIKYCLTWKALKLFWKLYVKKKGYKDGMYGLIWCILNVIGPEIRWLKIWEQALKEGKLEKQ